MNRRSLLSGIAAAAVASALPAQAQSTIPHSDLKVVWEVFKLSRTIDEAQVNLTERFGRLPWRFVGTMKLGAKDDPSPYKAVAVTIIAIRRDMDADILSFGPSVIMDMEIGEPVFLAGVQRFRVTLGHGIPQPLGRRLT